MASASASSASTASSSISSSTVIHTPSPLPRAKPPEILCKYMVELPADQASRYNTKAILWLVAQTVADIGKYAICLVMLFFAPLGSIVVSAPVFLLIGLAVSAASAGLGKLSQLCQQNEKEAITHKKGFLDIDAELKKIENWDKTNITNFFEVYHLPTEILNQVDHKQFLPLIARCNKLIAEIRIAETNYRALKDPLPNASTTSGESNPTAATQPVNVLEQVDGATKEFWQAIPKVIALALLLQNCLNPELTVPCKELSEAFANRLVNLKKFTLAPRFLHSTKAEKLLVAYQADKPIFWDKLFDLRKVLEDGQLLPHLKQIREALAPLVLK